MAIETTFTERFESGVRYIPAEPAEKKIRELEAEIERLKGLLVRPGRSTGYLNGDVD